MKKHSKILAIAAVLVVCLAALVALTACGEAPAEIKEVYVARGVCTGPADDGGPHVIGTTATSLILYTDGSYELIVMENGYMNAYGNSQVKMAVIVSYGTYTYTASEEEDSVEATIKLSKPTRIVYNCSVTAQTPVYLDTANAATFEEQEKSASEYLAENGKEYTLTVDSETKVIKSGLTA